MWTIPFSLEFISLASLSYINTHTLNGTTHINKVPQASRDCNPILVERTQPLTLIASLIFLKKLCFQQEWAHNPFGAFFHHFQAQSQLFFLSNAKANWALLNSSASPSFIKNTAGPWAGQFGCLLELLGFAVLWLKDPPSWVILLTLNPHVPQPASNFWKSKYCSLKYHK